MTQDKGWLVVIGIILLVVVISQVPKGSLSFLPKHLFSVLDDQKMLILDTSSSSSLLESKNQFHQVSSFSNQAIFSIKQPSSLFSFFNPTLGTYCCDSSCNYQCSDSSSGSYCTAWCDSLFPPTEKLTCPIGYISVGNGKCCPSALPNYCLTNNLCYQETNCGAGTLGAIECRTNNIQNCNNGVCTITGTESTLFRREIVHTVTSCIDCIGNIDSTCSQCGNGACSCDVYSWNANGLYHELNSQFFYDYPLCNLCSSNLCVRNSRCNLGEVKCNGVSNYYLCETIKPNYFSGSFNDFSRTLQNCPSGTICNVNKCEKDSDGDGFPDSIDQCPNNAPTERVNKFGCPLICAQNEVKLIDGTCKKLVQTCIDNNLNNICDADDPIVWADPINNVPICADRNGDRICDGVEGLFCKDSNNNKICDSDEVKWLATYCLDENGNGICDGIESTKAVCDKTISPVCDLSTNITYPNQCFATAYNVIIAISGSCKVAPIIIRRDCATNDVPIPSGYICDFETGWLFKRDIIYQNITIDCRSSSKLEGYTCTQVGENWVWTKTELLSIDCYSRGCPKTNQLCQGGICVESPKTCPNEIDCKAIYGDDSTCDEEIGLCTKIQFKLVPIPTENKKGFFDSLKSTFDPIPTIAKVIVGILIIWFILRLLL